MPIPSSPLGDRATPSTRHGGGGFLLLSLAFFISGALSVLMIGGLHGEPNYPCIMLWILVGMAMLHQTIIIWNASRHFGELNRRETSGFIVGGLGLLIGNYGTFGPHTDPHVYHYREMRCADHLRAIGESLRQYGDRYGVYPDRLETLIGTTDLQRDMLVCPASNDRPAAGATTREVLNDLGRGGHLSYLFAGIRLPANAVRTEQVIALDRLDNHGHPGSINVLYGDGHVETCSAEHWEYLFHDLNQYVASHP